MRPILIAGPTASGKSSLALKLANEHDGVVINADSLQVYECYQVLTARPSEADLASAPHLLYGHQSNVHGYSVGEWLREVTEVLTSIDKVPIIVGGTGLYFRALTQGLAEIPSISSKITHEVQNEFEHNGLDVLVERLKILDPVISRRIDLQNPRRVMRALEVVLGTEMPLSEWQARTPAPVLSLDQVIPLVLVPETPVTNHRIATRFEAMLDLGALDEVRAQMPFDRSLPANKALGAPELAAYLTGKMNRERAVELSIIATQQYAKRQRSWFRSNMKSWNWINSADNLGCIES